MKNFLYFAEAVVETGDDGSPEALLVPAETFLYANPEGTTSTAFLFKGANGNDDGYYRVILTHDTNKNKEVISGFINCLNANPHTGGIVICVDLESGTAVNKAANINPAFLGHVTGIAITAVAEGSIAGVSGGTTLSTSYGTGIVSTGTGAPGAPQYSRKRIGDIIVTTVKVDLTGLKAKGGDAGDAIGVGTTPAYFYKNVVAENGVIFKQTLACLETATQSSGTVTDDINVAWNSAATIDYDEAAGTGSEINAGAMAAGAVIEDTTAAITADHYAYLTEGSTEASDCVFAGGCYMLTLYGAALPLAPGLV